MILWFSLRKEPPKRVVFYNKSSQMRESGKGHDTKKDISKLTAVNFEMSFWCLQILPKNEQKQVNLMYHSS